MTIGTVHRLSDYTFASPRYHSIINYPTVYASEDYLSHDSINGTYDKNYPLYMMTASSVPKLELVNQYGESSDMVGDINTRLYLQDSEIKTVGKQEKRTNPTNTNLEEITIKYNDYITNNLNPGWCVIQTISRFVNDKIEYSPLFLVRALGNTLSSMSLYSIELDESKTIATNEFTVGTIVKYKKTVWKCVSPTRIYPPSNPLTITPHWTSLDGRLSVFYADLFVIAENSKYFMEIEDSNRYFSPSQQDDSLVSWNISAYVQ